ncbi:MAG: bile acid:sodium symporter [Armatimonadota bacterium]
MLARSWFYLALLLCFVLGRYVPQVGVWLKEIGSTPYLVAFAFFLNGLTLSTESLLVGWRQGGVLLASLLLIFVISPGLVLLTVQFLPGGQSPLADGFVLLAAVPTTLVSAVVLTRVAGGNAAVALQITVLANLLAIGVVPQLMRFTLGASGVALDAWGITANLALTVLLPTVAGQLVRLRWKHAIDRQERLLGVLAQISVLAFLLIGFSALPQSGVSPRIWAIVIGGGLALHLVLLLAGAASSNLLRATPEIRRALILSTAQKSLVITVFLWQRLLMPLGPAYAIAILPGITYYVIELTLDSILAQWWGQRKQ